MPVFSRPHRTHHQLQIGDHIWYHTLKGLVQHHGIWMGDGVIHFDDADTDLRYGHCNKCKELLLARPGHYVRFSCLTCWRLGKATRKFYTCEYGRGIASLVIREAGSRSMDISHPGDLVVARARWLFETNKFGRWELFTHNCEDFARFCKILKLGSKQSTRGLIAAGALQCSVGRTVMIFAAFQARRKCVQAKLILDMPEKLTRKM